MTLVDPDVVAIYVNRVHAFVLAGRTQNTVERIACKCARNFDCIAHLRQTLKELLLVRAVRTVYNNVPALARVRSPLTQTARESDLDGLRARPRDSRARQHRSAGAAIRAEHRGRPYYIVNMR